MKNRLIIYYLIFHIFASAAFSFVRTDGKQIIDKNGNEIIFRGIGIGGWLMPEGYMLKTQGYGSPTTIRQKIVELVGEDGAEQFYELYTNNFFTEKDVKQIKDWGFNSIRLPFHYNVIADIEPQLEFKEEGFAIFDSVLTWCEKYEIYLIFDMHAAPGGQNHGNISDSDGEAKLWTISENQDLTVAIWQEIATRYFDKEWVAGYDLLNEPVMPVGYDNIDLRQLYIRIVDKIREVDQNHMVIIEGNWYATDFTYLTPQFDQNIVYGFHKYWSPNTTGSIQQYLNIRNNFNVPIWLGEFGENSNHWFYEIIELVEDRSIGWNWWTYKKFDSITSPLSIPLTESYSELIKYWKGERDKPSVQLSQNALNGMAKRLNIDSCRVHNDVINAITSFTDETVQSMQFKRNSIPGRIQCENYDIGKNTVAYFDTDVEKLHWENFDPWNNGWNYRNDGVDVGRLGESIEAYYVGWTVPGEWLKYSIDIEQEGTYSLDLRVTSQLTSSTIELSVENTKINEIINIPGTSSWDLWEIINLGQFYLPKGKNTIIIKIITGSVNLDYFEFNFVESARFQSYLSDVFISKPFPNPFQYYSNLSVISNIPTDFEVDIVDIYGSKIKNLYSGQIQPGSYNFVWDGMNYNKKLVSSGNYFFLIKNKKNLVAEKIIKIN